MGAVKRWHLAASFAAYLVATAYARRAPAEISTSIVTTGFNDLEGPDSACAKVAKASKGFGASKINIVVTINARGGYGGLNRYYYKESDGTLVAASQALIDRYREGMKKCVQAALDAGFTTIHILPHVDPVSMDGKGMWRNVVKFDPVAKIGPPDAAFSYDDVVLTPVADALNAVVSPETKVEFTLTGEQGLSVFSYPKSWAALLDSTKARTSKGLDASKHTTGISFNWDKICGCVEPDDPDPIRYNNTYLERFDRFQKAGGLKTVDVPGVSALLDKADFLGASGYASTVVNISAANHEVTLETVAFELKPFGIDLTTYLFGKDKPFVYSEQGLGGYQTGSKIAPDLNYIAIHPFLGLWQAYEKRIDPWQNEAYRAYRRTFYKTLADWASTGGGPQYRIDGIYLWSVGSWDVHGVHPMSSSKEGSFKDDAIAGYMRKANAASAGHTPFVSRPLAAGSPAPPSGANAAAGGNAANRGPQTISVNNNNVAPGASQGATGNVATGPRPKRRAA